MQALLLVALAAISSEPSGVFIAGLAPSPRLAFVLQTTAVGTAVGSGIAARAKRRNPDAGRNPDADTWAITTAWATLGLVVGSLLAAAEGLL